MRRLHRSLALVSRDRPTTVVRAAGATDGSTVHRPGGAHVARQSDLNMIPCISILKLSSILMRIGRRRGVRETAKSIRRFCTETVGIPTTSQLILTRGLLPCTHICTMRASTRVFSRHLSTASLSTGIGNTNTVYTASRALLVCSSY